MSSLNWISVDDSYPELNDDVTSVLFVWDHDVFDGWPVEEEEHVWEASSGGGLRASVTHWAYFDLPGKGPPPAQGLTTEEPSKPPFMEKSFGEKQNIAYIGRLKKALGVAYEALEFYANLTFDPDGIPKEVDGNDGNGFGSRARKALASRGDSK